MGATQTEITAALWGSPADSDHQPVKSDVAALFLKNSGGLSASVADLVASTSLVYTAPSTGQVAVAAGDLIAAGLEGVSYTVAASGATDHHVTTAGGVKLYLNPGERGYNAQGLGIKAGSDTYASANSAALATFSTWAESNGGATVYFPPLSGDPMADGGYYPFAERLDIYSSDTARLRLVGDGPMSHLRCINTDGSTGGQRVLITPGNFKASGQLGENLLGGDRYDLNSFTPGQHILTLTTAGDATNLAVGMPVRIFSKTGNNGTDPDLNTSAEYQDINIIEAIDGANVRLRYPSYKACTDAVIAPGDGSDTSLTDWNGDVSRIWVGFEMHGLGVSVADADDFGWKQLGAMLECKFSNIHVWDARQLWGGNGFCRITVNGLTGTCREKMINCAYFSGHSEFTNVTGVSGVAAADLSAQSNIGVHIEENAHNIRYAGLALEFGPHSQVSDVIKITKSFENCVVEDFSISIHEDGGSAVSRGIFISFDDDNGMPASGITIRNGEIHSEEITTPVRVNAHANRVAEDIRSAIENVTFRNGDAAGAGDVTIASLEGSGLTLRNTRTTRGTRINTSTGTTRNRVVGHDLGDDSLIYGSISGVVEISDITSSKIKTFAAAVGQDETLNVASTTADNAIATVTIPVVDIGGSDTWPITGGDRMEISYSGEVDGTTDAKTVAVNLGGKTHSIAFAAGDTGLFRFDLEVTFRSNGTARLQGTSVKGSTLTGISDTLTFSTTAANDIELRGWVANAADNLDVQWRVQPIAKQRP